MDNLISAQEIKRRGISVVDEALEKGPVHVVRRNRPQYVILSEEAYQELVDGREAKSALWDRLLAGRAPSASRSKEAIDAELDAERKDWDG